MSRQSGRTFRSTLKAILKATEEKSFVLYVFPNERVLRYEFSRFSVVLHMLGDFCRFDITKRKIEFKNGSVILFACSDNIVDNPERYFSTEWKDVFTDHTCHEVPAYEHCKFTSVVEALKSKTRSYGY